MGVKTNLHMGLSISDIPPPSIRENITFVSIPKDVYADYLSYSIINLIKRISLQKIVRPWKLKL